MTPLYSMGLTTKPAPVNTPTATKLAITTQPSSTVTSGSAFAQQPVIQLKDVSNNNVSQAGVSVTVAIGTGSDTLSGTTTVTTSGTGAATFTNLVLTGSGSDTLAFSSSGLTGVTSNSITISAVSPLFRETFSTWANTAAFIAGTGGAGSLRSPAARGEDLQTVNMTIDTTVHDTGYTQSLRYDYPDATGIGGSGTTGRCTTSVNTSAGYDGGVDHGQGPYWMLVRFKVTTNFLTQAPGAWGCTSDQGLKFVDFAVTPGDRFSVGFRTGLTPATTGQIWFGYPDNNTDPAGKCNFATYGNMADGNWHEIKMYMKNSTGYPGVAQPDGAIKGWIDGVLACNQSGLTVTSTAGGGVPPQEFYVPQLGRNMNQGPGQAQSLWWQEFTVYTTDPGW